MMTDSDLLKPVILKTGNYIVFPKDGEYVIQNTETGVIEYKDSILPHVLRLALKFEEELQNIVESVEQDTTTFAVPDSDGETIN